jgi:hypothetical protein
LGEAGASGSAQPAGAPGADTSRLAQIPPPPRDPYVDPALIIARRGSELEDLPRLGDEAYLQSLNATADTVNHRLLLGPGAKEMSWGMYQYADLTYGDLPLEITATLPSPLPSVYYIGYSDYEAGKWRWQAVGTPTGDDTVSVPGTLQTISPGGTFYVVIATCHQQAASLAQITLHMDSLAPAPVNFQASDGFSGSTVVLTWTLLEDTYPGLVYNKVKLERSADPGGPWTQIAETPPGTAQYDDVHDGIDNIIPYNTLTYYRARTVVAMLPGHPSLVDSGYRLLHDVQNVSASDGTDPLAVVVNWDAVEGAYFYQIDYRCVGGGDPAAWTSLTQVYAPATSMRHTVDEPAGKGSVEGETYEYRLKAGYTANLSLNWSASDIGFRNAAPSASITATPPDGNPPLGVVLDASGSYDPGGGSIMDYEWDCDGDGSYEVSSGSNPATNHVYCQQGTYHPAVMVTDDEGDTGTASVPVTVAGWVHTWGGSVSDVAWAATADSSGNTYVAGQTASSGAGGNDVLLLMYDAAGQFAWARTWGTAGTDIAYGVATDIDGNAWLTGYTSGAGAGGNDVLILEFSPAGDLLLERVWGGAQADQGAAVLQAGSDMYFAGQTRSFGAGEEDALLLRLDATNSLVWQKAWGGAGSDGASGISKDSTNRVYLAGFTTSYGQGAQDVLTLAYQLSGVIWWSQYWGGASDDRAYSIVHTGNVVVLACTTQSFGSGGTDTVLLCRGETGGLFWDHAWGTAGNESVRGVAADTMGAVFLCGEQQEGGSATDVLLIKYSSIGDLLWCKTWGAAGTNESAYGAWIGGDKLLRLAGSATNAGGSWATVTGTVIDAPGVDGAAMGTSADISGTYAPPSGAVGTPAGIEDIGGGGGDALVNVYSTQYAE